MRPINMAQSMTEPRKMNQCLIFRMLIYFIELDRSCLRSNDFSNDSPNYVD